MFHALFRSRTSFVNLSKSLLLEPDAVLLVKLDADGVSKLRSDGCENTSLLDLAVEDHEDGDGARNTNKLGHGAVATAALLLAVLDESAGAGLLAAVLVLDEELVLQHDHVALALEVLHLALHAGAQAVERGAAGVDLLGGAEQVEPAQTGEDALLLLVVGELGLARDGPVKV